VLRNQQPGDRGRGFPYNVIRIDGGKMIKTNLIYAYDGSFDGLLTCIFNLLKSKEEPFEIKPLHDASQGIIPFINTQTDPQKSQEMYSFIQSKLGCELSFFIQESFLTCLHQKEIHILRLIRLGYKHKEKTLNMLTQSSVAALTKAVKFLREEANMFKGFVRFAAHDGILIAFIKPKNNVLPMLASHFIDRLPQERFLIYDETNRLVCIYGDKKCDIFEVDDFNKPKKEDLESVYQDLWKKFYEKIAIKERVNHNLRRSFMPKRFWSNIVEMEEK
jgi:probable DNA metabolism protein